MMQICFDRKQLEENAFTLAAIASLLAGEAIGVDEVKGKSLPEVIKLVRNKPHSIVELVEDIFKFHDSMAVITILDETIQPALFCELIKLAFKNAPGIESYQLRHHMK